MARVALLLCLLVGVTGHELDFDDDASTTAPTSAAVRTTAVVSSTSANTKNTTKTATPKATIGTTTRWTQTPLPETTTITKIPTNTTAVANSTSVIKMSTTSKDATITATTTSITAATTSMPATSSTHNTTTMPATISNQPTTLVPPTTTAPPSTTLPPSTSASLATTTLSTTLTLLTAPAMMTAPTTTYSTISRICSDEGENCILSKCCNNHSLKCYEKHDRWGLCKASCIPGVDRNEPNSMQTPWSCRLVEPSDTVPEGADFCCASAKDIGDYCGTCWSHAKFGPDDYCGKSPQNCANCGHCKGCSKWCKGGKNKNNETSTVNAFVLQHSCATYGCVNDTPENQCQCSSNCTDNQNCCSDYPDKCAVSMTKMMGEYDGPIRVVHQQMNSKIAATSIIVAFGITVAFTAMIMVVQKKWVQHKSRGGKPLLRNSYTRLTNPSEAKAVSLMPEALA